MKSEFENPNDPSSVNNLSEDELESKLNSLADQGDEIAVVLSVVLAIVLACVAVVFYK